MNAKELRESMIQNILCWLPEDKWEQARADLEPLAYEQLELVRWAMAFGNVKVALEFGVLRHCVGVGG